MLKYNEYNIYIWRLISIIFAKIENKKYYNNFIMFYFYVILDVK